MGYTHYWRQNVDFNDEQWAYACEFFHNLSRRLPEGNYGAGDYYNDEKLVLKGWDGNGIPICNETAIAFNGDMSKDLDHETFWVTKVYKPNVDRFDFCKTARKPYDVVVCAMLLMFEDINPNFKVSSDGGPLDGEEWAAGRLLWKEVKNDMEHGPEKYSKTMSDIDKIPFDPDIMVITQFDGGIAIDPAPNKYIVVDYDTLRQGNCPWCGNDLPQDGSQFCDNCDIDWDNHTMDDLRRLG